MTSRRKYILIFLALVILVTDILCLWPAPSQKLEAVGVGPSVRFGDNGSEGDTITGGLCISAMGRDDKGVPFIAVTGSFSGCQNNTTIYPIGIALNSIIAIAVVGLPYYGFIRFKGRK